MSVISLKKDHFRRKTESPDLKEIYLKTEVPKKGKLPLNDTHLDPSIKGVPVDYSFRKVFSLAELESGTPREYRVGIPKKSSSGKYISRYAIEEGAVCGGNCRYSFPCSLPASSSLWANYNHLTNLNDINSFVNESFHKPDMIGWLDVSFNEIEIISEELLQLTNLKILYMHGNNIKFFIEVGKLKELKQLKTLTLHGNPIEENPGYRSMVIKMLPQLVNFDFSLITK